MLSLVKTAWKIMMGVKDALVLLFLILFFAMLYAGLKAARMEESFPASGALYRNQGSYVDVVANRRLSYTDEPDPELRAGRDPLGPFCERHR